MIAAFLERTFGATFQKPDVLDFAFALALVPLLYLLRRRAATLDVPFLPFWERVLASRRAPSGFWRKLLSAALQTTIGAVAILAVAGPYEERATEATAPVVLVVDRTAPTYAAADATARAAADFMASLPEATPIVAAAWSDGRVRRIGGAFASRDARDATSLLPPPFGSRDVAALESFAAAFSKDVRAVLVTPFDVPSIGPFARFGILPAGDGAFRNGGIRSVRLLDDAIEATLEGAEGRTLTLEIEGGATTTVAATARTRASWPRAANDRARLFLTPPDAYPLDDATTLVRRAPKRPRVLVVSEAPTPELDSALVASLRIDVEGSGRATPKKWRAVASRYDVVVLSGVRETAPLPKGRYVAFNSAAPGLPFRRVGRDREDAGERRSDAFAPLAALDPIEWRAKTAGAFALDPGAEALVDGRSGVLLWRFQSDDARGFAFATGPSIADSTLPLLPAFPLLVAGMFDALVPTVDAASLDVVDATNLVLEGASELAPARAREAPFEPMPGRPERRSYRDIAFGLLAALLVFEWLLYHAGVVE